jgi:hypothetical protein
MRKILMATVATAAATLALTSGAKAQPVKPVAPGTVVVHVNGYLQFEIAGFGSTDNRASAVAVAGTTSTAAVGAIAGKLNPITTDGDARLYAGFDAETLNGIAYGAQIEARTTTSDANVGAGKVTGSGSTTGSSSLYIKRAYGYVGSKEGGYVRLGQGDGPFSLLQSGVVEAFGDGAQFNTDGGESSLLPTAATPSNFIYADASNLYATDKIVYLTPAIAGFSAGFSYEPNSDGLKQGYGNCGSAISSNGAVVVTTNTGTNGAPTALVCADESSSSFAGDIGKRRKNTVDAAVQYALKSDGVAYKVGGGILYGAPIDYIGAAKAVGTSAVALGYDNLEVYEAGAQATFAGLTLGANIKGGAVEDGFAFKPKGARDGFTYIVGASYVIGPYVLGASFYDGQTAGAYYPGITTKVAGTTFKMARTLSEYGIAAGANYVISPNLSLFAQYEYGHKHQPGNSAIDVSSNFNAAPAEKGDGQVTAIATGATFKF